MDHKVCGESGPRWTRWVYHPAHIKPRISRKLFSSDVLLPLIILKLLEVSYLGRHGAKIEKNPNIESFYLLWKICRISRDGFER